MRLTHIVKVTAEGRAGLEASIHPSEHPDESPIRIVQGPSAGLLWLTWDEFDAIADLVWAHRPEVEAAPTAETPEVTYAICGHRARHGVCVMAKGAHPRHINASGADVEDGSAV